MYIILLAASIYFLIYAYIKYIRKGKPFKNNKLLYICLAVNCIVLMILLTDLPFFFMGSRQITTNSLEAEIISIGSGRKSADIIAIYKNEAGEKFWSGVPIGHEDWIKHRIGNGVKPYKLKYLPVTRIVTEITYENDVVYNSMLDIGTIVFIGIIMLIVIFFKSTSYTTQGK